MIIITTGESGLEILINSLSMAETILLPNLWSASIGE